MTKTVVVVIVMVIVNELLVVSVTPQNLERGDLWFKENLNSIKKARISNPWWRDNSLILQKDLIIRPSEFLRKLVDFGYERGQTVTGKGLFAARGGLIEIWPINTEKPYLIEFRGNVVETISERKERAAEVRLPSYQSRTSIDRLTPGGYVVHVDHGIGIYRGQTQTLLNQARTNADNYFVIEYAPPAPGREPDKLYVPTDQKDRLSPYVGFETPRIHRLGGAVWFKTKRRAREDAEKLAKELLELYARRNVAERPPYPGDETLEQELRESFSFIETKDQIRAEKEIAKDLGENRPMDRILCGDVGFGKTEIAIRAALRVIASGKQVALLSPTTILASQHEKTFSERFKNLPIEIRMLSRLTQPKDERQTLKDVAGGKIDCVIGTHRLLSKDISFKNLGMVIIDEEQRFGVKQKERFKELKSEIDILSLSATPIPRTLSLALAKLRDISLIETPPPERLPINTLVLPYSKKIIAAAIEFEIARGGQIYYLHNRIETINAVAERLKRMFQTESGTQRSRLILEHLRLDVIHGRMKEKELIKVMDAFRNRKIDVLLATTIIENGLDISSANTLIVDDATRLGLAQAHQLRGRIGRSSEQAYAYFLYPVRGPRQRRGRRATRLTSNGASKPRRLTDKATERLEALKEYAELGAGYQIALRDLEIRGAGNILGKEQSGAINKVGLNLYCQMLSEEIEAQKM